MTNINLTSRTKEDYIINQNEFIKDIISEIESAKTDLERAKLDLIICNSMDHYIIDYISKLEENIRRLRSVRISAKKRIKIINQ